MVHGKKGAKTVVVLLSGMELVPGTYSPSENRDLGDFWSAPGFLVVGLVAPGSKCTIETSHLLKL